MKQSNPWTARKEPPFQTSAEPVLSRGRLAQSRDEIRAAPEPLRVHYPPPRTGATTRPSNQPQLDRQPQTDVNGETNNRTPDIRIHINVCVFLQNICLD